MPKIFIDNKPYETKDGLNLLQACLDLGFDIPYFCWHPALHSVGACRLCAVKQFRDDADTRGKIIMSCMTPVAENMRISIDDPEVKEFRAGIIELLMLNHPHDCPVCDEGGECHLQDMTLMTGHVHRRTRFRKRTYRNQYLGPFLNHEMNRCIHCYRCVRFYRDYAGGRDLEAFSSHHNVYFGRHEDGVLQNVFSGNLVEVCPTGVFTDKTLKQHFTRMWDLQTAPSICIHCGLGCNTIPGERYGTLRRIRNRYNSEVNRYFLCDRGRFGYEFVNHKSRLRNPVMKKASDRLSDRDDEPLSKDDLFLSLSGLLHFGARVIGIGSPRASLEANYALRTLVGPENFYSGMSKSESGLISEIIEILRSGPARSASLLDVAQSDAVFILGEDLLNTAPLLAMVLRQTVRNSCMEWMSKLGIPDWNDSFVRIAMQENRGPLFIATPDSTGLDDIAERTFRAAPEDIARLGFAVAHALDPSAPPVTDPSDPLLSLAEAIAEKLKAAKQPLVISGTGCGNRQIIHAAANVSRALCASGCSSGQAASLCFAMPECNSLGLGLMQAGNIVKAFDAAASGTVETVIILENDLFRRAEEERVSAFLGRVAHVVVIDFKNSRTVERADILLPSGTFAETGGTIVNNEGRAQRFFKVFAPDSSPDNSVEEGWRWVCKMLKAAGRDEGETWKTDNDITKALAAEMDIFSPVLNAAPPPEFREKGMKVPRQSHRYSGRTAMSADKTVHEPKPQDDPDSPLSFSMEGFEGKPPPSLLPRYWSPGWNSVQSLTKYQREVDGPLCGGDPGQRLIELRSGSAGPTGSTGTGGPLFFDDIPPAFSVRENGLLVVPLYHIFGSEELSVLSPGIAELTPKPYLLINAEDAEHIGVEAGDEMKILIEGVSRPYHLTLRISKTLPRGVAGLPVGLPTLEGISLPSWCRVSKAVVGP